MLVFSGVVEAFSMDLIDKTSAFTQPQRKTRGKKTKKIFFIILKIMVLRVFYERDKDESGDLGYLEFLVVLATDLKQSILKRNNQDSADF